MKIKNKIEKRLIRGPLITVIPKETIHRIYILNKRDKFLRVNVPVKILLGPSKLNINKIFNEWINNPRRKNQSIENFCEHLINYHRCCELKFKTHRFYDREKFRNACIF